MANIKLTANERQFVTAMNNSAGAVGRLSAELNIKLARAMRESEAISRQFAQGVGKIGEKLQNVGQSMSTYLTLPLTLAGGAALKAYGELDSLKKGLLSIEGTLPNVEKRLVQLREAAKMPGLGFQEAIQGDVRLRSVGIAAETSMRILKEFGNANALTGGGKEKLSEIISQLSQMSAKGKVVAQDLKPIIEAAPSVSTAIKQMFGTVDSESIQNKLTAMGKSSTDFINDLLGALEKTPRVAGGFKNAMENATDSIFVFAAGIGEAMNKSFGLEGVLNNFSEKLAQLQLWFQGLSPEVQKFILGLAGIVAIAGPLMIAVGGIVKAYAMLFTGTLALTAAISGIALAVGGLVYLWIDYQATQTKIANASKTLAQVETEVKTSIHAQAEEVRKHTDVLNDNNSTLAQRKTAIEALKQISPEYFGKLDSEKIKYEDLNVAVSKYITNLENAAKANLVKAQIDASIKAEQDILNKPSAATSEWENIKSFAGAFMSGESATTAMADRMALNAAQAIIKIREARKPLEAELKDLFSLGYKPINSNTGQGKGSEGKGAGGGIVIDVQKEIDEILKEWQARKDILGKVSVKQIDQYAGDTVEEIRQKGAEILQKGIRLAFQTAAETDFMKSQNTPFPIHKAISFSEKDVMASINYLNERVKELPKKIQFLPGMSELNAESERFKADLAAMQEKLIMDLGTNFTVGIGEALGEAIMGKGFNIGHVFQNMFNIIGDYMIKLGRESIAMQTLVKRLQETMFNPAGIGISAAIAVMAGGGLLKGLAGSLFNNTPKFANGGIVYGPTMGIMGEYAGARSNPEVIAPLSKLKDMIGGGGGGVIPDVKISGEDIYISFTRYKKRTGQA